MTTTPLPRGLGWIRGTDLEPTVIYSADDYIAIAAHGDCCPDQLRITLSPADPMSQRPSVYLSFTPEQWAAIAVAVSSVLGVDDENRVEIVGRLGR